MIYEGEVHNENSPTQEHGEEALLILQTASEAGVVNSRISREVCLKSNRAKAVVVSSKAAGLVPIHPHRKVSKWHACRVARDIMDIHPERPSFVNLKNFSDPSFWLQNHQKVAVALGAPWEKAHITDKCFS